MDSNTDQTEKFASALFWMFNCSPIIYVLGFPGGSVVKQLPANVGDAGLIPGLGRSTGEGNGNPFKYSCLGTPMDRGAWWATIHGLQKSQTRLSN